jgi:hypothetical protein
LEVIDRLLQLCALSLAICGFAASAATPPDASSAPTHAEAPAISFNVLPQGEHRELVIRACAICHPPELVVSRHRTADEWDVIIARMINLGALADNDEQEKIFAYLVSYFGKDETAPATPATP